MCELYHDKKQRKMGNTACPADAEKPAGGRYGNRKVKNGENK